MIAGRDSLFFGQTRTSEQPEKWGRTHAFTAAEDADQYRAFMADAANGDKFMRRHREAIERQLGPESWS